MKINELYKPLYTSGKRYFLITGGRGSLKSTSTHDFITRLTYEKGHGVLFTRYTLTSAEKSIIPEFESTLDRLGCRDDFKTSGLTITNIKTGSFIMFSGIKTSSKDLTANLKSLANITTWVVDEGEDFKDEKIFDKIDDSIRTSTHQNRVIWIMNPTTKEHFIYSKFIKSSNQQVSIEGYNVTVSTHPEVEHIHTTYHIAEKLGYLSQSWLAKCYKYKLDAENSTDKYKTHYYYNYIGGWLEKAEGIIFDYTEGEFDYTLPSIYSLDWGYYPDPMAISKVAVDTKQMKIYMKEIFCGTENNDVSEIFKQCNIQKHDLIICDTNEPRTRASLVNIGYNIQNAVKLEVVEDIREIKQYQIIVSKDSPNIKAMFNNYIWNDKKASIPGVEFKHFPDTLRYGFRRLTAKNVFMEMHAQKHLV